MSVDHGSGTLVGILARVGWLCVCVCARARARVRDVSYFPEIPSYLDSITSWDTCKSVSEFGITR